MFISRGAVTFFFKIGTISACFPYDVKCFRDWLRRKICPNRSVRMLEQHFGLRPGIS